MTAGGASGEPYLRAWHRRHPGATAAVMAPLRDGAGQSSYETLVAAVSGAQGPVLDLGCGDGLGLELLGGQRGSVGLDASDAELAAARVRLPAQALIRAEATSMPLADGRVGAVTCHLALMLMQPLERVLAELARVMLPDAQLAAMLPGGTAVEGAAITTFRTAWRHVCASYRLEIPDLQDVRALDPETLTALFTAAGFVRVTSQSITVAKRMTAADAADFLMLTYLPDLLPETGRRALRAEVLEGLSVLADESGTFTFAEPLTLITAHR